MDFILKFWLYLGFALAGAIGFYLWTNRKTVSFSKMMVGLIIISLPLHMFEERIFPGGFHYIYGVIFGTVQTQLVMLSCNATALIVLTYLFIKKGNEAWMVVLSSLFGFIEFMLHLVEGVTSYQMFSGAGLIFPYSPGFATAAVLMLPISVMGAIHLVKGKKLTWKVLAKGFAATVIFAFSVILLPNIVFNNSAYPFPDNGFYELFLK